MRNGNLIQLCSGRYYQGSGVLSHLGGDAVLLGRRALVVADAAVWPKVEARVLRSLEQSGVDTKIWLFSGHCCPGNVRSAAQAGQAYGAELVVGVPDSGLVAAKGYSEQSGIPYGMAFHKNSYVGRTFIKPKQSQRESSVKIKLNVIEEVVRDKRIVMVDDSIVRGTTCANIIKMLKRAGAKEVHVRISSPPFLYPCYFGTDVPSNEQLIAHSHTTEEIRELIGADSLGYMKIDKLKNMVGSLGYCDACFTGNYPMEVPGRDISHAFE